MTCPAPFFPSQYIPFPSSPPQPHRAARLHIIRSDSLPASPDVLRARFEAEVDARAAELGIDAVEEEDLLPIAEAYARAAQDLPPGWVPLEGGDGGDGGGSYRNVVTGQVLHSHPSKPQFARMLDQIRTGQ